MKGYRIIPGVKFQPLTNNPFFPLANDEKSFQIFQTTIFAKKELNMAQAIDKIPTWLMITVYVLILAILGVCTDLFTFLVGTGIMTLIFAGGYDRENLHDH